MIKFDAGFAFEAELKPYRPIAERRGPYIDIMLKLERASDWPAELDDPGALIICTTEGEPIHFVVQNEGCDTDYGFTEREKEQLLAFVVNGRWIEKASRQP